MRKLIVICPVGHSAPDLSAIRKLVRMTSILSVGGRLLFETGEDNSLAAALPEAIIIRTLADPLLWSKSQRALSQHRHGSDPRCCEPWRKLVVACASHRSRRASSLPAAQTESAPRHVVLIEGRHKISPDGMDICAGGQEPPPHRRPLRGMPPAIDRGSHQHLRT
jgi:hypothetical protein